MKSQNIYFLIGIFVFCFGTIKSDHSTYDCVGIFGQTVNHIM